MWSLLNKNVVSFSVCLVHDEHITCELTVGGNPPVREVQLDPERAGLATSWSGDIEALTQTCVVVRACRCHCIPRATRFFDDRLVSAYVPRKATMRRMLVSSPLRFHALIAQV